MYLPDLDLPDLDRRAVAAAGDAVAAVRPDHLELPTPCAGWSLEQLLRHMVGHNHGFAAAARGEPDERIWDGATLGDDPVQAYRSSAADVTEAFGADGFVDRKVDVFGYGRFSAPFAVGMHFVDFLVHGWDVAMTVGVPPGGGELADAALQVAATWREPAGRPPGGPFGPKVEISPAAPALDRLVAHLGRSPHWPAKP